MNNFVQEYSEDKSPEGKIVVLLHCYLRQSSAENLLYGSSLLYEACTTYKLKIINSLWCAVDEPPHIDEIMEILHKQSRQRKVIVITNNYKLAENHSPEDNKLSSLITSGFIELYQAKRAVILTKIKV